KIPFNMYWKINRKKITIIGNSVKNIAPKDFSNHKKNYFLFIGSLNKRKGLDSLLNTMSIVSEQYPEVKLIIAGDGPEKENILKKISDLNLNKIIKLVGSVASFDEKERL